MFSDEELTGEFNKIVELLLQDDQLETGDFKEELNATLAALMAAGGLVPGSHLIKLGLLIIIIKLLLDKKSGLKEIKKEIMDIEEKLDQFVPVGNILTTGPVVTDVTASSLVVKILNNTGMTQTVAVTVFDITECPKEVFATETFELDPKCSDFSIFDANLPVQYEVQFEGMEPGVYAWTATRTQAAAPPLMASNFVAANTFRHQELVPQLDP